MALVPEYLTRDTHVLALFFSNMIISISISISIIILSDNGAQSVLVIIIVAKQLLLQSMNRQSKTPKSDTCTEYDKLNLGPTSLVSFY